MNIDDLIALHSAGPAIVMMSRDDAVAILTKLKNAEFQLDAARKQTAYMVARQHRQQGLPSHE
jgi:hypothetical protein